MGTSRICAVGAAALVVAAAGGAARAADALPELAFVSQGDVWVANADGSGVRRLTTTGRESAPAWSPDGTRIAFVSSRDGAGLRRELYVMNADGTRARRLTDDADQLVQSFLGGSPAWSPDGTRIAFVKRGREARFGGADVWVADADGSDAHRVTADAADEQSVQWASSTHLIYAVAGEIRSVAAAGGRPRLLVNGLWPALSPDRTRLAYVENGNAGRPTVHVSSASGESRRALTTPRVDSVGQLAWSPDGSRIVSVAAVHEWVDRFRTQTFSQLWLTDVEAGTSRRITGYDGPAVIEAGHATSPLWWPGGERLFYQDRSLSVIEADGDCDRPYTAIGAASVPVWRPGARPAAAALRCVDLWTRAAVAVSEVGRGRPLRFSVTIRNVGNELASQVRLRVAPPVDARVTSASTSRGRCELVTDGAVCSIGTIEARNEALVTLMVLRDRPGLVRISALASSVEPDVQQWNDGAEQYGSMSVCGIVGTWGNDVLRGTARGELICARPGRDRIDGRGGNDRIEAGSGADLVFGGGGRDVILAGGGGDVIRMRDGERDVVACGTERDTVVADRADSVARDCEQVTRS